MKIFKAPLTENLPKTIGECEGKIFLVFEDGKRYPINESEVTMRLFQKLWESTSCGGGVELAYEDENDFSYFRQLLSMH